MERSFRCTYRWTEYTIRVDSSRNTIRSTLLCFREKFAEFVTELSRQSLIVRNDERRPLYVLYDVSHGERLAAARYSDENLTFQTVFKTFGKALYSLGLVTRRLIFGM